MIMVMQNPALNLVITASWAKARVVARVIREQPTLTTRKDAI